MYDAVQPPLSLKKIFQGPQTRSPFQKLIEKVVNEYLHMRKDQFFKDLVQHFTCGFTNYSEGMNTITACAEW